MPRPVRVFRCEAPHFSTAAGRIAAVEALELTYADDAAPGSVMRHLPDFAAIRRRRCRVGNAKIHDEHFGATEAYVDGLVEAINRKDCNGRLRRVVAWVMKSLTLPLPRSMRATLKPVKVSAPVPVGMEPVSAMKMSPLKPKSSVREKSNILAEPWLSGISAKAGWTFSVARNSSEKANCGHGERSVGGGGRQASARGRAASQNRGSVTGSGLPVTGSWK